MTRGQPEPTPASLGYRWPAEWEPHEATWLAWPHNRQSWPGKFDPIPAIWRDLAATIARHEPVHILAGGEEVYAQAREMVGDLPGVVLHDIPTNDAWVRDHGPIFLQGARGSAPALADFDFNAWGGKYPPYDLDNDIPRQIAKLLGFHRFAPGIVLEGGSIEGNGRGTLLTTEQCLLNANRNPTLAREVIEQLLRDYLGAVNILWLDRGIEGDDTDGHIDELARFVGPSTVLAAWEDDPGDANHVPLVGNLRRLQSMKDERESPLEIIPVPMPQPRFHNGQRLPCSYLNFYIANGLVVVPQFGDPADDQAMEILGRAFPDRRIVGMEAIDLVWGLGGFHCITQQQPRAMQD